MSRRSTSLDSEALLEHAGWMRQLAVSLVGDAQRAEDLAQDTWVRALQNPPSTERPLRGWLATVMRNVWRQERRGDVRRADRERRIASETGRTSSEPEGLELLERVTMQRELVEAVIDLNEPYRTTLLLRYFEELSPKRIASRQGVPVSTVKTQLARGLERLRERLDADHGGDGKQWLMALLPVTRLPEGLVPPLLLTEISLGALVVNAKLVVTLVALSAVGAGFMIFGPDDEPLAAPTQSGAAKMTRAATVEAPRLEREATQAPLSIPVEETRQAVAAAPEEIDEVELGPGGVTVKGRVIDVNGRPMANILVVPLTQNAYADFSSEARAGDEPRRSGDDGSFSIHLSITSDLGIEDERYVTYLSARPIDESTGAEVIIVIAPKIQLAGHVIDEFGAPVADGTVMIAPPPNFRASLGWVVDHSNETTFRTKTAEDGSFELRDAPALPDGTLIARASGFHGAKEMLPSTSRLDLVVVLERPVLKGDLLTGIVVGPRGKPVPEATVSMGIDTTVTGSDGSFSFRLGDPQSFNVRLSDFIEIEPNKLIAVKPGYLPGELQARGNDGEGAPIWPDYVIVRLGDEPMSIEGRVVNQLGDPIGGAQVWLGDPTFFGGLPREGRDFPRLTFVETELSGGDRGWPFVETDERGAFRLEGLLDRAYSLNAIDPVTLMQTSVSGIAAGERKARIVMSFEDAYEVLRGRIIDGRGNPIGGVRVVPTCDAYITRVHGQTVSTRHANSKDTTTDATGRFELSNVPRDLVYLRLTHPETIPLEWGRQVEGGLYTLVGEEFEDVTVTLMRRCHFQIELRSPSEADWFEVFDADGTPLQISEFRGNGRREGYRIDMIDGMTNQLAVGDTAATLVLHKGDQEVKRIPLQLDPDSPTTIRP